MKNPFDRHRRDDSAGSVDPIEDALRGSLTEHARQAPTPDPLADRIIAAADRQPSAGGLRPEPRRGWRTFTLPAIAAAAVAAIVGGALAIQHYHPDSKGSDAAHSVTVSAPATTAVHHPTPSVAHSSTARPTTTSGTTAKSADTSTLNGVQVIDLTFTASDDGWGLASADCIGKSGRCTALIRTTDGSTWQSVPGTPFRVPGVGNCASPCVDHLRFANDEVGYAWGDDTLFMTTNGGQKWVQQSGGGASAVETLSGVVVRVIAGTDGNPCSGTCRIETAPIGSSTWTRRTVPVDAQDLTNLGFAGSTVVLTASAGPGDVHLLTSSDRGTTWTDRGRPCASSLVHLAGASDGTIAAECAPHQGGAGAKVYTAVSTDGGRSFGAHRTAPRQVYATSLAVLSPSTLLLSYDAAGQRGALYRSSNGGRAWSTVVTSSQSSLDASSYEVYGVREFLGFESGSEGRFVAGDQRTIWTTRDAGQSWTPVTFH